MEAHTRIACFDTVSKEADTDVAATIVGEIDVQA